MRYFFWFWTKVIRRAFYIILSRKAETRKAYTLLKEIEHRFEGKFNAATKRKIAVSYGIYKSMVCDAFTQLHGRYLTPGEQQRFIYYFICSSLFDDFTDYELISPEQLYAISFQPDRYQATTFDEKVFLYSHQLLRDFVRDKSLYDEVSRTLFHAQMRSKEQYNSVLTPEEIQQITFEKGGNSVLLCSFYLDYNADEHTYACWYKIGTLIQLTNDLYDIHKDLQDNISTLPDQMTDAHAFEAFFASIIDEMKALIKKLPCSLRKQQEFSLSMAGIYAFGLIAIDQLKKIQGRASQLPDLKKLPRKDLIIDMEKIKNLAKWFRFVYRYAKL